MEKSNIVEYKEFLALKTEQTDLELAIHLEIVMYTLGGKSEEKAFDLMLESLGGRAEKFRNQKFEFWRRMKEKYSLPKYKSFVITNDHEFKATTSDDWLRD